MRVSNHMKPMIMGGLMGLMMMWMLHGALTGGGTPGASALVAFVAAHVGLAAIAFGAVLFAARLSPRTKALTDRLPRPSFRHVGLMLAAALIVTATVHLVIHGGIA